VSDDEILDLFLFDQKRAMSEFFNKHGSALFGNLIGYALSKRYGNAFVEDVSGDAAELLYNPQVRNEIRLFDGKILAYLTKWGKTQLDTEARAARRRLPLELDYLLDPRSLEGAAEGETPPSHLIHLVRSALDLLRPRDRGILILRYGRGLSEEEIAAQLRIKPGTAKKRLYDARERLRRGIEGLPEYEEDDQEEVGEEEDEQAETA
jgi:RNA polymerase sigma factor (sigma-70 family)